MGPKDNPCWKAPQEVLSSSPASGAVIKSQQAEKTKGREVANSLLQDSADLKTYKFKNYGRKLQKRAMLMDPTTETPALAQPVLVMCRAQSPLLIPRQPGLATPRG